MGMTVGKIVAACDGKLLCGDPDTVVTDSREVTGGSLFVPLKGKKTDAHTFLHAAFISGAVAALTQEHTQMEAEEAWIAVDSTQLALQYIAAAYRKRFPIPAIGITGSVGKTTTKEMVALALSARYNMMKTRGNHNSQIGLPLMMFEFSKEHEAAVVEMGVSDFGEMAGLARVAEPKHFEVGVCAAEKGVDILLTVGPEAKAVAEGARSVRSGIDCRVFDNNDQAVAELKSFLSPGDAVLVKGSRGMHTDEIVRALKQNGEACGRKAPGP